MNMRFERKEVNQLIRYHTNKIKSFADFINMADEEDIKKMLTFVRNKDILKKIINDN